MPRVSLGKAAPSASGDRQASEREALRSVTAVDGYWRQLNFRLKPEEWREFEELADRLDLTFTGTLLEAVRYRTEALKKGQE